MDKIQFTDDLKLGVESIDNQHSKLVDLINRLIEMEAEPSNQEAEAHVIEQLVSYIDEHFTFEEQVMKEVGYENFEAHRATHVRFVKKTINFSKQHRNGEVNLGVDVLMFLSIWLIEHIKGEDPKFAEKFKAAGY